MQEETLYTPEELAARLKLSKYTVYEMIKRGDIPAHHIGRSIRVSESQLRLYLMTTRQADNLFEAEIVSDGETKYARIGSVAIAVSTPLSGRVRILIPPEDIILSSGVFESSARNKLRGTVTAVSPEERGVVVVLDVGVPLHALITRQSLQDMGIKPGDTLYAVFKTMSVRILK